MAAPGWCAGIAGTPARWLGALWVLSQVPAILLGAAFIFTSIPANLINLLGAIVYALLVV